MIRTSSVTNSHGIVGARICAKRTKESWVTCLVLSQSRRHLERGPPVQPSRQPGDEHVEEELEAGSERRNGGESEDEEGLQPIVALLSSQVVHDTGHPTRKLASVHSEKLNSTTSYLQPKLQVSQLRPMCRRGVTGL